MSIQGARLMRNALRIITIGVMVLMTAGCLRSFDRTHIPPLPTPSGYDLLPQQGLTVCWPSDEYFVSTIIWQYPFEDRPKIDNWDIGNGFHGRNLGVIGACEEVQIDDIRWAPFLGRYMVLVEHHDRKGWILESDVCIGDTPILERKCAYHAKKAPPTPVPTPEGLDRLPARGIVTCGRRGIDYTVKIWQFPDDRSLIVGRLEQCSMVTVEETKLVNGVHFIFVRQQELAGWTYPGTVCLDEPSMLLRRCPLW